MVQLIKQTLRTLLLSGAFLVPTTIVSTPAQAGGINIGVDIDFWGTHDDYVIWCREVYPDGTCVEWDQLTPEMRVRYRDWWVGRHPHEHWGRGHEKHHEHEGHHHR